MTRHWLSAPEISRLSIVCYAHLKSAMDLVEAGYQVDDETCWWSSCYHATGPAPWRCGEELLAEPLSFHGPVQAEMIARARP